MIFITGAARSGTSLTAGILSEHGLRLGDVNPLNENTAIRDGVVKKYLKSIGCDPMGQKSFPDPATMPDDPKWRDKVIKAHKDTKEPWGYKCAKLCYMFPLWVEHLSDAKYILVRRDKSRIINSCLRTSFMSSYKTEKDWSKWADNYINGMEEMKKRLDCIEVWPQEEMKKEFPYKEVVDFCNLPYSKDKVLKCFRPELWHG